MPSLTRAAAALLAASLAFGCSPAPAGSAPPASAASDTAALAAIREAAVPLRSQTSDFDPLIASIGGASRILLGESTHGTHEYYRDRATITMRLIREASVNAVAIEGDWSPTYRANLYVRGLGNDRSARQALRGFTRFPFWMWPNAEFAAFVEQLRAHNLALPAAQRVGLYGMDVYDLYEAADAVVERLHSVDPEAARRARSQYRCFARYGRNTHTYGQSGHGACRDEAAAVLADVAAIRRPAATEAAEAHFNALRAASSVVAAEEYFRTVYSGANAWNVRDRRMEETVEAVAAHAQQLTGRPGKVVVWSHNTHSGDARATFAASQRELNLGQLMKQRHGNSAYLVGFFTNGGTVLAAPEWDQPGRRFDLRPALPNSYSGLFHRSGIPAFLLVMRGNAQLARQLSAPMLERAVGVVYVPQRERTAHYFEAVLPQQFDAAIFYDRTEAVRPL